MKSKELRALARSMGAGAFAAKIPFAVLVGGSVQSGSLKDRNAAPSQLGARKKTHLFKAADVADIVAGASLEHSIFPVIHGAGSQNSDKTRFFIGRGSGNEIIMNDFAVSEQHACISVCSSGGFRIQDTNSTNGTKLNDRQIFQAPQPLRDGDKITFGRYNFTFLTPSGLHAFLTKER